MPAWTQAVLLAWRPELRFFERRHEVLRALDDEGLLRAFQWKSDSLSARLGPHELIDVRSNGLGITLGSPRVSHETSRRALSIALDMLEPKQVILSAAFVQSVIPITADSETAASSSVRRLVPALSVLAVGQDWAVIVDGSSADLGNFQVEFGVIRAAELVGRVTRQQGRVSPLPTLKTVVDDEGLPGVSMFFAWSWITPFRVPDDNPAESVCHRWSALLNESERLGLAIMEELQFEPRTLDAMTEAKEAQ